MKSKTKSVTCFGEVLWDIFPTYKKIGGAPLNVALRLQSLGIKTHFISRIGNDTLGHEILDFMLNNGLDTSLIQTDMLHKTGCVNVTLDKKGSASYEIEYPVAWDKIERAQLALETVKGSDAFIFGSLSCRDDKSKSTLLKLLDQATYKIFDVNLRPPFYTMDLLLELMQKADFVKMNDEELDEICDALNFSMDSITDKISYIADYSRTEHICITLGKDGAILYYDNSFYRNPGYSVEVADTVGAGDSFLASIISRLLLGADPSESLDFACAVGALVAGREGANPKINPSEIENLRK